MKRIYSVNDSKVVLGTLDGLKSRITTFFPVLAIVLMLMLDAGNVWGKTGTGTWTAKVTSSTGYSTATATVWRYNVASSDDNVSSASSSNSTVKTASHTEKTNWTNWALDSYYPAYTTSIPDGYSFDGWYGTDGKRASTAATFYPREGSGLLSHGATDNNWSYQYDAKFIPVTVNSVASNSNPSTNKLKVTKAGKSTATVVFNVSNADDVADFSRSLSGDAGWEITGWSYASNKVTVTLSYTCTNTTAQGDYSTNITLTSKAQNGTSKSATVVANVDLTPTLSANKNSIDFGTYTLAKDTKKSNAVTLSFNTNAINFEKTADATLAPFSAVLSNNNQTLTVYFEPTVVGSWEKDLVVTVKNSQNPQLSATQTIHLTGNAIRNNVTYTCNIADNYDVDADALNLASLWTSNNKEQAPAYDIVSFTPSGNNNEGATAPAINNNVLSLGQAGTLVLSIYQPQTQSFNEKSDTKTISINKRVTTSNGEDYIIKVNETHTANYGFTNTSAPYPSNNLADDFYYTIDEPNFDNAALNKGTELITYDPATNQITGHNAGTTKITFFQKETYKYTGATLMCNIAVEKRENKISNSWSNVWQKTMSENGAASISFSATHKDYTNYPIVIEQIYGEDVATLTGDASEASITTNTTKGYAIWHLSQAENYEYNSAEADVMVMVGVPAPPTCYVYEDYTEHEFMTHITDAEGHFETPIAISAPVDKIWFYAKKDNLGVNKFVVQYSKDNGKNWKTFYTPTLDKNYKSEAFSATFPSVKESERITHVRFGAETGATLRKWYKDVRISRKAYLNIQDAEKNKISKLPTMMCTIDETSTATAKFYIDYSTCADEIIIESSNTENFTVSRTSINVSEKHDNLTSNKEEITVTYHSTELGTHNAVITIRTSYQACALSVSGETTKRTPTLTWQEGYTNNPLTLPVGLTVNAIKPAATTTSTALIKYESSDENVVKIIEEGYAFTVVGTGSAILTAIVPENDKWKSVSDTRVIQATEKVVQEIVWNQTFPRFMEPGNVIDLDAKVFLRNLSTGELTYSEERSQYISYSCPLNNGIVSISGAKMTVLNYGEVKISASVGGNADYEAAASVTVLINVRQPSEGCETQLVFHKEATIDMFEVDIDFSNYANLTTQEMVSAELLFDPTKGKPDKLSFQYEGEEFKIGLLKYFGGFIKFEQRVNSQWLPVENSRVETVKNEWNTKSDLQLDVNADALRIIRETGATGHHKIKDIQVTRKQYLRATKNEINLGEITMGQTTPVIIGFEYSDVKGDLTARTINNTTGVTIKDNGAIDVECGSVGHYDLPITFTPTQVGDWHGTIEIYDNIANLSTTVQLTATVTANEEYIFNHEGNWNIGTNWTTNLVPDENADIIVAKNMTINSAASVKSMTIEEGVTVTVKSGVTLVIGKGAPKGRASYGSLHIEDGAQVILDEEASLPLKDFILDAKLGITEQNSTSASSSGQVTNESQLAVNGDAYFQLTLDPSGRNTLGWYDFVLPFAVDVIGGISIKGDEETPMQFNVNYAVMDYSEAKRAVNGKCWNKFRGTMEPGKVYTITLDEENPKWNTVIFKKKAGADVTGDRSFTTEYSGLGADKDNGWNGLGNGTLHHTELDVPEGTLIQMYDHTNRCYQPREAKDYTIPVGLSFFLQFNGVETINLDPAEGNSQFRAPSREPRQVSKFRLSLKEEGAENAADKLWVSANEEATGEYVIGQDVLKMGTINESKVARLWSVRNNITLCSNDMPMTDNKAEGVLGLYAPKAGYYTLEVENGPEDASLYLTHNGEIIWDLTSSPYVLDLVKGTTDGYGLRIEARAPQIAAGVDNTEANAKTVRKVLIGDKIYLITPEGKMYDAAGKGVKF